MAVASRYQVRQELTQLIERGTDTTLHCPLYLDGALVAPTSGINTTYIVYDEADEVVASGACTISSSIAELTILGSTTSSLDLGAGWRIHWQLTVPGEAEPVLVRQEAALVRYRLRPAISDVDLIRRVPSLDPSGSVPLTSYSDYQSFIEECDVDVQSRLLELGRRPWLVASPAALRQVWLYGTILLIFEDAFDHRPEDGLLVSVERYRKLYDDAWRRARLTFDWDMDGDADSLERTGPRHGVVWLG